MKHALDRARGLLPARAPSRAALKVRFGRSVAARNAATSVALARRRGRRRRAARARTLDFASRPVLDASAARGACASRPVEVSRTRSPRAPFSEHQVPVVHDAAAVEIEADRDEPVLERAREAQPRERRERLVADRQREGVADRLGRDPPPGRRRVTAQPPARSEGVPQLLLERGRRRRASESYTGRTSADRLAPAAAPSPRDPARSGPAARRRRASRSMPGVDGMAAEGERRREGERGRPATYAAAQKKGRSRARSAGVAVLAADGAAARFRNGSSRRREGASVGHRRHSASVGGEPVRFAVAASRSRSRAS